MIPYNHKKRTYSLQKDVVNLIVKAASPTLWMYFIQDDSVPNNTFHYSKFIQADSLGEAKKKILYSNMTYLFKIGKLWMTASFANEIVKEYNFRCKECLDCHKFINSVEYGLKNNNGDVKMNLYFVPINGYTLSLVGRFCLKHGPTNQQLLHTLEKYKVNFCIDDAFKMVNYFSYQEKKIALRKIDYN